MSERVPLFDLTRYIGRHRPELMAAFERVLETGRFILGEEVERFEEEVARHLGLDTAVGVASGTDALRLSLLAAGVGAGDRVLTSAFTFFGTASAILATGARPLFADIEPASFNLDPESVAEVLEGAKGQVRALMPVHLFGGAARMDRLLELARRHHLVVVEDAAQALGATWKGTLAGTLGDFGCFSFFPTKNLGAFGDAGLVVADRREDAECVRMLRVHGSRRKYHHERVGTNSRLDALQAALLRVQLGHLERRSTLREARARQYRRLLEGLDWLSLPALEPECRHVFHQYTIRVPGEARERLREFLAGRGIATGIYYPSPCHLQPAVRDLGYAEGDFPQAERACREVLSLPMFPELEEAEVERVAEAMCAFQV